MATSLTVCEDAGAGWNLIALRFGPSWRGYKGTSTMNRSQCCVLVVVVAVGTWLGHRSATACAEDHVFVQIAKLVNPAGGSGDDFGCAVAFVGGDLLVAARRDDTSAADAGAVYVFALQDNVWTQTDVLFPSDATAGQWFGMSIATDPTDPAIVVIGASHDSQLAYRAGAAYVFVRDGDQWTEEAKLLGTDTPGLSMFGEATDIDGDRIIVGAPLETNPAGTYVGNAYIFERDEFGQWGQTDKLQPLGAVPDAAIFGTSVALDGDLAVVGAPYLGMEWQKGAAYFYGKTPSGWLQEAGLRCPFGLDVGLDRFGVAVDLVGDLAVVGASHLGSPGGVGLFASFARDPGGGADPWTPIEFQGADDWQLHSRFGGSLTMNAERLLVGAPSHGDMGAAYLYELDQGMAIFEQKLTANDGGLYDYFGSSLAMNEETLAIGASYDDDVGVDAGAVYVYESHLLGDLNCDGVVDTDDIRHFSQALTDPAGYGTEHDGDPCDPCSRQLADMHADGVVDGLDVKSFVGALISNRESAVGRDPDCRSVEGRPAVRAEKR